MGTGPRNEQRLGLRLNPRGKGERRTNRRIGSEGTFKQDRHAHGVVGVAQTGTGPRITLVAEANAGACRLCTVSAVEQTVACIGTGESVPGILEVSPQTSAAGQTINAQNSGEVGIGRAENGVV